MSLQHAINNWRTRQTPDEVALFGAMIDYFNSQSFASVVKAHQTHKHTVSYTPLPPYDYQWAAYTIGGRIQKEISDVFFVVFSSKRRIARMTHLQAKLKTGTYQHGQNFSFKLDAGQYHMLHNRLEINDHSGKFPNDILSFPLYSDSISSYGVFYQEPTGKYNMAYEIASLISTFRTTPYKSPHSQLSHSFVTTKDIWGYVNKFDDISLPHRHYLCGFCYGQCMDCIQELLSTVSIDTFEKELLNVRIGTRVDLDLKMLHIIKSIFEKANTPLIGFKEFFQEQAELLEEIDFNRLFNALFRDEEYHFSHSNNQENEENGGVYILINADEINNDHLK